MRGESETHAEDHAPPTAEESESKSGAFGGLTPAEAAWRRWERRRERELTAEASRSSLGEGGGEAVLLTSSAISLLSRGGSMRSPSRRHCVSGPGSSSGLIVSSCGGYSASQARSSRLAWALP
jgi:hypothetical protein